MKDANIQVNLKAIRAQAALSLTQAAKITGVSKAMLGQVERGESSPTIMTLWKIAKGFHVPLTALIEDMTQTPDKAGSTYVTFPESITFQTLFPFDPRLGAETFVVSMNPRQSHISMPHDTGVVEDIFVLRGDMEIMENDVWTPHKQGDSLRFKADQPHGYRNSGQQICQFHNTIYYPAGTIFEKLHKTRR